VILGETMADPDTPMRQGRKKGGNAKMRQSMGLSGLSGQIYRKVTKKGYEFNLMVCGERNLGKSTLLATLFGLDAAGLNEDGDRVGQPASAPSKTVTVSPRSVDLTEHGVNLRLTIIDTPGFSDFINNRACPAPLEQYIDDAFRSYMQDESRADRKNIVDRRVHCLLYVINPSSHGLKPIDVITMKRLHQKVNIVPVIAKSDMLTKTELATLKQRVLEDVAAEGINIFMPGIGDDDDDDEGGANIDANLVGLKLAGAIPFAVIGSTNSYEVEGAVVRGRQYPWGVVEVDNEQHCDFALMKKMIVNTHLHDLKDLTEEVLYERFRMDMLEQSGGAVAIEVPPSPTTTGGTHDQSFAVGSEEVSTEALRRKHEEMARDLEEQSRLLAEQRRQFEEERKKFESQAAAKAAGGVETKTEL